MPRSRRTADLTSLIAAALLLWTAVGCTTAGNEAPSSGTASQTVESTPSQELDPTAAVQAAAERTFSRGSFHVVAGFEFFSMPDTIGFTSDGDVDVENDASIATATFEGFPGMPNDAVVEMVQIGSQFWMRSAALGTGDAWITFDIEEAAKTNPQLAGMGTGMNDPRVASNFLAGAQHIKDEGLDERNGEEMTRYVGTVNFEKASAAADPEQQEGIDASIDAMAQMGATVADAMIWVDLDGYVREIRYVIAPEDQGVEIEVRMYSVISEIGEPVSIDEPAGTIVDLADVTP